MTTVLTMLATVLSLVMPGAAVVTPFPTNGVADYQLGGAYRPAANVTVVTRDSTDEPVPGVYSICYVNAFQTQPGRLWWWRRHHPKLLLRDAKGRLVHDPGWPEVLLDIRTASRRRALAKVIGAQLRHCAAAGFQAVEPDNLDSWTRSKHRISRSDAVAYARLLVARAHDEGLAIAQKNAPQLARKHLGFDFAVAEECEVYRECPAYARAYGRRLVEIEYTDNGRKAYRRACAKRGSTVSVLLRDRDVVPRGAEGYVFRHC